MCGQSSARRQDRAGGHRLNYDPPIVKRTSYQRRLPCDGGTDAAEEARERGCERRGRQPECADATSRPLTPLLKIEIEPDKLGGVKSARDDRTRDDLV